MMLARVLQEVQNQLEELFEMLIIDIIRDGDAKASIFFRILDIIQCAFNQVASYRQTSVESQMDIDRV